MPHFTPEFQLPYPIGTDPITNGDNTIQALAERVELLLHGTDWVYPALGAGWSTTATTIGYRRDAAGNVHVQGSLISPAAAGAPAWTMPAGFRPPVLIGGYAVNTTAGAVGNLSVLVGGEVNVNALGATFIVNAVYSVHSR